MFFQKPKYFIVKLLVVAQTWSLLNPEDDGRKTGLRYMTYDLTFSGILNTNLSASIRYTNVILGGDKFHLSSENVMTLTATVL
jgi:hypothetical protein